MENNLICPNCKGPIYFALDGYGRTPWHLHCDNCKINIGVGGNNRQKAIELIQIFNKKNTYIEYYNNDIQILWEEEGKIL